MYTFVQKFHSGWAYLALLLLILAVINSFLGMTSKKDFTAKDRKIALFGLIATHIQLLVGFILYFISPLGLDSFGQMFALLRQPIHSGWYFFARILGP